MWLERFAGQSSQSTPSATPNRTASFSPAPRRSVQLGPNSLPRRPGLNPRSSSLSIASLNASTDTLPPAARVPNGSNLKNELGGARGLDVSDPVEVVESLLGPLRKDDESLTNGHQEKPERPETFIEDIDFGGLSLEEFAKKSRSAEDAASVNGFKDIPVIDDFEKEKDKFDDLHKSILACDEVLKSVETYLTSFRSDLATVSAEIETLQNRSTTLNNKLENRKAVEKLLGPEVEAFTVAPSVVRKITEGAVDEAWVRALDELEKKSKTIDARIKEGRGIKAIEDIKPVVDDVSAKAVERIRDFMVAQIKSIRSPSINAQVIQQNSFLRYKDVFSFLAKRQPELAEEISQAYINTMRWYYLSHFTRYKTALLKLNLFPIDQSNTIAGDPPAKKTGKPATFDVFSIGRRMEILRTSNDTALPSFAAEDDKATHHIELPFRNFNLALVDNASAEYAFLTEFFSKQPYQTTNRKFSEIFQPTFELGASLNKQLTDSTLDALGVLTCVRLNQHFAFELQRRKVPAVEGYVNSTNMLLWPRFQIIMDAHAESIRKATASLTGKPAGSALSLTSSASSAAQTTAPHPLTQRYANFLQGILALSSEAGDDEPVSNSVRRLRNEFEAFLVKLSKGVAEARKRERFLFNNYSLVCTIVAETEGKLADELKGFYLEKRDSLGVNA